MTVLRIALAFPALFAAAVAGSLYPLWFALALYVLTSTGAEFRMRRDVHSIMVLSGALGAVQVFTPLGSFLVAGVLPALIGPPRGRATFGLYVLLLFVPVLTAALLLFVASAQIAPAELLNVNWQPPAVLAALQIPVLALPLRLTMLMAAALPFALLLFWMDMTKRKWPAIIGGVLLASSLVATGLGSVLDGWAVLGSYAAIIGASLGPRPDVGGKT